MVPNSSGRDHGSVDRARQVAGQRERDGGGLWRGAIVNDDHTVTRVDERADRSPEIAAGWAPACSPRAMRSDGQKGEVRGPRSALGHAIEDGNVCELERVVEGSLAGRPHDHRDPQGAKRAGQLERLVAHGLHGVVPCNHPRSDRSRAVGVSDDRHTEALARKPLRAGQRDGRLARSAEGCAADRQDSGPFMERQRTGYPGSGHRAPCARGNGGDHAASTGLQGPCHLGRKSHPPEPYASR